MLFFPDKAGEKGCVDYAQWKSYFSRKAKRERRLPHSKKS